MSKEGYEDDLILKECSKQKDNKKLGKYALDGIGTEKLDQLVKECIKKEERDKKACEDYVLHKEGIGSLVGEHSRLEIVVVLLRTELDECTLQQSHSKINACLCKNKYNMVQMYYHRLMNEYNKYM